MNDVSFSRPTVGGPRATPEAAGEVAKPAADIEDRAIRVAAHGEVSVRVVPPGGATWTLPCVMYLHGGCWVPEDEDTHDPPTAVERADAGSRWVAEHGASAHLDVLHPSAAVRGSPGCV